jgi:hypothetical protein
MSSCGNATCAEPLDNANLALFIQWFWEKLGIKDAMSILAQLPDVSGYVSHKLLSLETLSWLDDYVFRHVRKPSSGLVMPVGVWWPWHIIYLFMYLFIYILHMRMSNQICRTASQTNQRASTISPFPAWIPMSAGWYVYIYMCVCICDYDLLCLYTSHQIYVYIYIYTNIHLTNLMIYIYNCVCVHILSHKRAPASTSDWLQDMNSSKEMAPEWSWTSDAMRTLLRVHLVFTLENCCCSLAPRKCLLTGGLTYWSLLKSDRLHSQNHCGTFSYGCFHINKESILNGLDPKK